MRSKDRLVGLRGLPVDQAGHQEGAEDDGPRKAWIEPGKAWIEPKKAQMQRKSEHSEGKRARRKDKRVGQRIGAEPFTPIHRIAAKTYSRKLKGKAWGTL